MRYSASFSHIEALLARVHGVASEKRTAFQARLKNFLRLGLIDDVKAGRGKAAKYDSHHILMLALAMELSQIGVAPEKAVAIILGNSRKIAAAVLASVATTPDGFAGDWSPTVLYFDPKAMAGLTDADPIVADVEFCSVDEFKEAFRATISEHSRLAVISITAMIVRLADGLNHNPQFPMGPFFGAGIREWAVQYDQRSQA